MIDCHTAVKIKRQWQFRLFFAVFNLQVKQFRRSVDEALHSGPG